MLLNIEWLFHKNTVVINMSTFMSIVRIADDIFFYRKRGDLTLEIRQMHFHTIFFLAYFALLFCKLLCGFS